MSKIRKLIQEQAKSRARAMEEYKGTTQVKRRVLPLPKPVLQILRKRGNRPIRVVFLCEQGISNSAQTRQEFISYLRRVGLDHNKVFSLGFDSMDLARSKYNLRQTDYFVETLPGLLGHLPKSNPKLATALKNSKVQIIGTDKLATVNAKGELEYPSLVKEILAREAKK